MGWRVKTSTKNVVLGCILTAFLSIPSSVFATIKYMQNQNQEQEQNQNQKQTQSITVNINGQEVLLEPQDIEELNSKIVDLESQNEELLNRINQLETLDNPISNDNIDSNVQNMDYESDKEIFLNEMEVFNCQYYDRGDWVPATILEWNSVTDKAADGNTYDNAVHMAVSGNWSGHAQIYVVDYLLNGDYKTFNGNFMLDESCKSTASVATLNIYGDDEIIYSCGNITGGLVPQNTGDISVENVNKLRFEFTSTQGELGSNYANFGVVFYDTILK